MTALVIMSTSSLMLMTLRGQKISAYSNICYIFLECQHTFSPPSHLPSWSSKPCNTQDCRSFG